MGKGAVVALALLLAVAPARAQEERVVMQGDIIDNMCAEGKTTEQLAAFVGTHTKECALMPGCIASGYGLFSEGTLLQFDRSSNERVVQFLGTDGSKLQVEVQGSRTGNTLRIETIQNSSHAAHACSQHHSS